MRRDLDFENETWTETYTYQKRPTNMKRELQIWKENYKHEKRPTNMKTRLNRNLYISKETYRYEKRFVLDMKETYTRERDQNKWKETYKYEKGPANMKRDFKNF